MRTSLTFQVSTISREPFLNTREFCTVTGPTMISLMKLWKRLCLQLSFTRRMQMLTRPDDLMLHGKCGVDFFSTSELQYRIRKFRLRVIRTRHNFILSTKTQLLVLELLIVHFTLVVVLSGMIITRNEWTCLHIFLQSSTKWRL